MGRPPQVQRPMPSQPSARPSAVQSMQAEPAAPQLVAVRVSHESPLQQPEGHEVELHWHASPKMGPEMHCWPASHGGPPSHWQTPRLLHWSARRPHGLQARPPKPHCEGVGGLTQVLPEQHPVAQVVGLHALAQTPEVQTPPPQLTHAAPPTPHRTALVPGAQVLPSQHPEQDEESQTQTPPLQRWPVTHGPPVPQLQVPSARHRSVRVELQEAHAIPGGAQDVAPRPVQV